MAAIRHAAGALVTLATLSAPARAQTFDFEGSTPGTRTPLSITSGGVTATFTSAAAGAYEVSNASRLGVGFSTLTGNFLIQPSGSSTPLTIGFSSLLSAIAFNFATAGGSFPLTFQAFQGATLVGSANFADAIPPGFFNGEGVASFSGASFDRVILSGTTLLAVDNVTVRAAVSAVPEPTTVVLLGAGLAGVGALARRRRRVTA